MYEKRASLLGYIPIQQSARVNPVVEAERRELAVGKEVRRDESLI